MTEARSLQVKVTVGLGLAILVGALATGHPKYALLAPAPYVGWVLWRYTAVRLCFVILGGVFVLSSGVNHVTLGKVAYFAGVALAAVAIVAQPALYQALRARTPVRAIAPLTLAIGVIVVVSLPVAHAEHTQLSSWFRDATAYGLLAVTPLFIWDAARADSVFHRIAPAVLYAAAAVSGLSLILEWLTRRHDISASINSHVLPSIFLPAAAAFLLVREASVAGRRHARWDAVALAIPLLIFLAGTRSAALLLVCVAAAIFVDSDRRRRFAYGGVAVVAVGVAAVVLLVLVGHSGHPGIERVAHRITSIPHTILHPGSDQSYRLRAGEWHVAWETFKNHPLLGAGLGHLFVWKYGYHGVATRSGYNLDTPLVYLGKFGILGLVALAVAAAALVRFARVTMATGNRAAAAFAWLLVFALLNLPFEMPFELKDFTLALMVLGGLAAYDPVVAPHVPAPPREAVGAT
jgi:hypothetical protein